MSGKIETSISLGDILAVGLLWIILIIITVGFALAVFPYSMAKFFLNRTYIWEEGRRYKMVCSVGIFGQIGDIILWTVLTIVTVGLAYPFYLYLAWNKCLNSTVIEA